MRRSFVLAAACAILVSAASSIPACGSNDEAAIAALAANCAIDSDCTNPLVCAFQTCHVQCETTADCTSQGLGLCIETDKPYKVCQNAKEEDCTRNSECPGAEVCAIDEKCRDACVSAKDCVTGQSCVSGVCADPSALVDGALPLGDGGAAASGEPCTYATVCPGALVCLRGICTEECITDKDCELSFVCESTRCVPAGYDGSVPVSGDAAVGSGGNRDGATSDASSSLPDAGDGAASCPSSLTFCGGSCIDTTSSATYCHAAGACGTECPSGQYCSGGTCSSTCNPPSQICGPNNSCVDTRTDPANCAACGLTCDLSHVTIAACSSSACVIGRCATGFADCNGMSSDGCETDTQTSANNCGGCRLACASPAACDNGTCSGPLVVASGQNNPRFLAVDGTSVYWTNQGSGSIAKAPMSGGPTVVLATGQNKPNGIYVGALDVYWTNIGDNTSNGSVASTSATGNGTGPVTVVASGEGEPYNVVSDGNTLYWADTLSGLLRKAPLVGGSPSTVATINTASPFSIAVQGGTIFAVESSSGGVVVSVNIASGMVTQIASGTPGFGIGVDSTSVYWGNNLGTYVVSTPLAGGMSAQYVEMESAQNFATDGTYVYWTNASGSIVKLDLANGGPVAIATGQSSPFGIVIAGNSLFWSNSGDGTIMKLTPR